MPCSDVSIHEHEHRFLQHKAAADLEALKERTRILESRIIDTSNGSATPWSWPGLEQATSPQDLDPLLVRRLGSVGGTGALPSIDLIQHVGPLELSCLLGDQCSCSHCYHRRNLDCIAEEEWESHREAEGKMEASKTAAVAELAGASLSAQRCGLSFEERMPDVSRSGCLHLQTMDRLRTDVRHWNTKMARAHLLAVRAFEAFEQRSSAPYALSSVFLAALLCRLGFHRFVVHLRELHSRGLLVPDVADVKTRSRASSISIPATLETDVTAPRFSFETVHALAGIRHRIALGDAVAVIELAQARRRLGLDVAGDELTRTPAAQRKEPNESAVVPLQNGVVRSRRSTAQYAGGKEQATGVTRQSRKARSCKRAASASATAKLAGSALRRIDEMVIMPWLATIPDRTVQDAFLPPPSKTATATSRTPPGAPLASTCPYMLSWFSSVSMPIRTVAECSPRDFHQSCATGGTVPVLAPSHSTVPAPSPPELLGLPHEDEMAAAMVHRDDGASVLPGAGATSSPAASTAMPCGIQNGLGVVSRQQLVLVPHGTSVATSRPVTTSHSLSKHAGLLRMRQMEQLAIVVSIAATDAIGGLATDPGRIRQVLKTHDALISIRSAQRGPQLYASFARRRQRAGRITSSVLSGQRRISNSECAALGGRVFSTPEPCGTQPVREFPAAADRSQLKVPFLALQPDPKSPAALCGLPLLSHLLVPPATVFATPSAAEISACLPHMQQLTAEGEERQDWPVVPTKGSTTWRPLGGSFRGAAMLDGVNWHCWDGRLSSRRTATHSDSASGAGDEWHGPASKARPHLNCQISPPNRSSICLDLAAWGMQRGSEPSKRSAPSKQMAELNSVGAALLTSLATPLVEANQAADSKHGAQLIRVLYAAEVVQELDVATAADASPQRCAELWEALMLSSWRVCDLASTLQGPEPAIGGCVAALRATLCRCLDRLRDSHPGVGAPWVDEIRSCIASVGTRAQDSCSPGTEFLGDDSCLLAWLKRLCANEADLHGQLLALWGCRSGKIATTLSHSSDLVCRMMLSHPLVDSSGLAQLSDCMVGKDQSVRSAGVVCLLLQRAASFSTDLGPKEQRDWAMRFSLATYPCGVVPPGLAAWNRTVPRERRSFQARAAFRGAKAMWSAGIVSVAMLASVEACFMMPRLVDDLTARIVACRAAEVSQVVTPADKATGLCFHASSKEAQLDWLAARQNVLDLQALRWIARMTQQLCARRGLVAISLDASDAVHSTAPCTVSAVPSPFCQGRFDPTSGAPIWPDQEDPRAPAAPHFAKLAGTETGTCHHDSQAEDNELLGRVAPAWTMGRRNLPEQAPHMCSDTTDNMVVCARDHCCEFFSRSQRLVRQFPCPLPGAQLPEPTDEDFGPPPLTPRQRAELGLRTTVSELHGCPDLGVAQTRATIESPFRVILRGYDPSHAAPLVLDGMPRLQLAAARVLAFARQWQHSRSCGDAAAAAKAADGVPLVTLERVRDWSTGCGLPLLHAEGGTGPDTAEAIGSVQRELVPSWLLDQLTSAERAWLVEAAPWDSKGGVHLVRIAPAEFNEVARSLSPHVNLAHVVTASWNGVDCAWAEFASETGPAQPLSHPHAWPGGAGTVLVAAQAWSSPLCVQERCEQRSRWRRQRAHLHRAAADEAVLSRFHDALLSHSETGHARTVCDPLPAIWKGLAVVGVEGWVPGAGTAGESTELLRQELLSLSISPLARARLAAGRKDWRTRPLGRAAALYPFRQHAANSGLSATTDASLQDGVLGTIDDCGLAAMESASNAVADTVREHLWANGWQEQAPRRANDLAEAPMNLGTTPRQCSQPRVQGAHARTRRAEGDASGFDHDSYAGGQLARSRRAKDGARFGSTSGWDSRSMTRGSAAREETSWEQSSCRDDESAASGSDWNASGEDQDDEDAAIDAEEVALLATDESCDECSGSEHDADEDGDFDGNAPKAVAVAAPPAERECDAGTTARQSRGLSFGRPTSTAFVADTSQIARIPMGSRWQCGACLQDYGTKQSLERHIRTVHGNVKAFKCPKCTVTFGHSSDLKRHIRTVHGGEK